MTSIAVRTAALLAALAALAAPQLARADDGFDKSPEDTLAVKEQMDAEASDKMPGEKDKKKKDADEPPVSTDVKEIPGKAYRFVGMRFRDMIFPKFMTGIFAEGGGTVNVFAFGPELSSRKDGLEFDLALSFADYSFDPMLFRGHDENQFSWEEVSSSLKAMYLTMDILYDIPLDKEGHLSALVGGGVGLGFMAGDLHRNQVEPRQSGKSIDANDAQTWQKCTVKGSGPYCDTKNDHYDDYTEPSWANGGSKPFILPWISLPQVSLRYKPIKQLQLRGDAGFSLSGVFLGASAGYGF